MDSSPVQAISISNAHGLKSRPQLIWRSIMEFEEATVEQADRSQAEYDSHVYVLENIGNDLMKIGKANSVLERAKAFGMESIDWERSFALRLRSAQQAVHVEKSLHRTFKKWRVSRDAAIALGVSSHGATEWFSRECRDRLVTYLESNADLLDITVVPPIALREMLEARELHRLELEKRNAKKVTLQVCISKDEARAIKIAAAERDKTISQFLAVCVQAYMKSYVNTQEGKQ